MITLKRQTHCCYSIIITIIIYVGLYLVLQIDKDEILWQLLLLLRIKYLLDSYISLLVR